MTLSIRHLFILFFMICTGIMCQPEKVDPPTLTGKLVLTQPCAGVVIQVLQGSIDPSKIDPLWKDSITGMTYINVFTVSNQCTFPGNLHEGDTIAFQLDSDPPPPSPLCDMCAISSPVPPIANYVRNVRKLN